MDTTTEGSGAEEQPVQAQPQEPAAVTEEDSTSQEQPEEAQATEEVQEASAAVEETQADDVKAWAEKKGLPLDDPVKLAQMYRDAEKKMHEATQPKPAAKPLETIEATGNPQYDQLVGAVNEMRLQQEVNNFFQQNPDAEQYRAHMAEIANNRPWINDLDAIYALAKNDPNREASLKAQGGKEALTNLAQKQSAVPPKSSANNTSAYETGAITPQNVNELVAKNDNEWFTKNYEAINRAMEG